MKQKIIIAIIALAGYGIYEYYFSTEAKLIKIMKCAYVSNQLEQPQASRNIDKYLASYVMDKKIEGNSYMAMQIGHYAREELDLHGRSLDQQLNILMKTHNSSTCRKMHKQEKINKETLFR